jgi:hypothetical protein
VFKSVVFSLLSLTVITATAVNVHEQASRFDIGIWKDSNSQAVAKSVMF